MSIQELTALAREHWMTYLPQRVRYLQAQGTLDETLQGAAALAQAEIEQLKSRGYQEHEAREVALLSFVLLPAEPDEDDEQARELAEMEAEYQRNPAVEVQMYMEEHNDLPIR